MFESEGSLTAPTLVYLARHGETVWNVERRFQGHLDSPLTERGVEQARRLGQRLAGEPLRAVYSSDLGRTITTAEQVAAPHGLSVQPHQLLREIDTGDWTRVDRDAVRDHPTWGPILADYQERPWMARLPNGESVGDVQRRGLAFLEEIAPAHAGQAVAVIAHHVVVEAILAEALGLSLEGLWLPHRGGNCFVSLLEISGSTMVPKVIYDGSHIGELAGLDGTKGDPPSRA
jgi:broad specificity phosphatase PhoE